MLAHGGFNRRPHGLKTKEGFDQQVEPLFFFLQSFFSATSFFFFLSARDPGSHEFGAQVGAPIFGSTYMLSIIIRAKTPIVKSKSLTARPPVR